MFERLRSAYYVLFGLAACEIILAISLGQSGFWHFIRLEGLRLMTVLIGGIFPLIWIAKVTLTITYRKVDRPTIATWRMIVRQRIWLLRGIILTLVVLMFARSFSSFKSSISRLNPFWADNLLVNLDYSTFGIDPWRLSHAVIGATGTIILDRIYIFWFMMMFLTLGWFCYTKNPKLQIRGLLSYLICWGLLGGVTAVVFSSVGPCFYEQFYGDDRFAPLMANLNAVSADSPLYASRSMRFLIESLGVDRLGGGISAMPSMHVTIAMLSFLAVYTYAKSTTLKIASGLFAVCIFIGSVHLGWHYAWDGIFGIIAVTFVWWTTGRFVDRLEARDQSRAVSDSPKFLPATA